MVATALDRTSGVPLYEQIKRILIAEIYAADTDDPEPITEESLIQRFHVSRAPIRQALRDLANEGYVYRERAKGTFPVPGLRVQRPPELEMGGVLRYLRDQGLDPESHLSEIRRIQPPEEAARQLDVKSTDEVLEYVRVITVHGEPFVRSHMYLSVPQTYQPVARDLEEAGSAFALLGRDLGIVWGRGEHRVWATSAGPEEASALKINRGDPILVTETTLYSREGRPVGWRRGIHRGDEYKYVFTVTRYGFDAPYQMRG
jgi:GntR family transcriptional regulator